MIVWLDFYLGKRTRLRQYLRLSPQKSNRHHNGFIAGNQVDEAVGKAIELILPRVPANTFPGLRKFNNPFATMFHCDCKLRAKPVHALVVVGNGFIDFAFGVDREAQLHVWRCLAKTSCASRAGVSPLR